jgi:hypothetical protein
MPWIIAGIFGLIALACGANVENERTKRKQEQERSRRELEQLGVRLASREQELEGLRTLLGAKNEQVRILVAEVERLRLELADARRRAAV